MEADHFGRVRLVDVAGDRVTDILVESRAVVGFGEVGWAERPGKEAPFRVFFDEKEQRRHAGSSS